MILPHELQTALNQKYGYILLIKGSAGTGKTTLALEIMHQLKNTIYISTRVNPDLLYDQFPWIKQILPEEQIIDATTFESAQPFSLTDELFLKSFHIYNLPDFVKIMLSKMKQKSGTIVIDSWDAIQILGETRWGKSQPFLANYIINLTREKKYNLILIAETDKETYLDYLVDGIVKLEKLKSKGDRLLRQIHLEKLRGVQIKQSTYLFTLNLGHFGTFLPSNEFELIKPIKTPPETNNLPQISSGIPPLDKLIGVMKPGWLNLIEVAPYLGTSNAWFLLKFVYQFLSLQRGIIGVPPPGRDYANFTQFLKVWLDNEEVVDHCLRVIEFENKMPQDKKISQSNLTSHAEFFELILKTIKDLEESDVQRPFLIAVSIDHLPFKYNLRDFKGDIPLICNHFKKLGHITLFTSMSGNPAIQHLRNEMDSHYIIDQIHDQPVIYFEKPKSSLYAINYLHPKGYLEINLTPIV